MQPRMTNPALSVPGALDALQAFSKAADTAAREAGVPQTTIDLVSLRASQINGCAVCLDMHSRGATKRGVSVQQLATLAGWRDAPYFDAKHFDERGMAAIVASIAAINAWNRLNVITGQVAGEWTAQWAS